MNINDILNSGKVASQNGHTISTEESIILYNSLLILQNENHFYKIFFWGRIFGIDNDYYIAFGYRKDALFDRTFYYSINCVDWGLLPLPTDYAKKLAPFCLLRFQGDPAVVVDVMIEKEETTLGYMLAAPLVKKLKEEDRLSVTVHTINDEATIAPRGALFKRPDGIVVENLEFYGLDKLEARERNNYLHTKKPLRKWNTNLLTRDDYNYAMDFLDPIDIDVPERAWSIVFSEGDTMVCLKYLYWPGFYFYHYLKTARYGFVYFGYGVKCIDVPFLTSNLEVNIDEWTQIMDRLEKKH